MLVFPGLFRGALDARATTINREMMLAAAYGIAECVTAQQLALLFAFSLSFEPMHCDVTIAPPVAKAENS